MRLAKAWCFQFQCVGLHYMCVPLCFRATQRILQVNVTVDLIPHLQIFLPADSDFCVQSWMTSGEKLLDLNVGGVMRVCALERGMDGSNYLLVFSSLNLLKKLLIGFCEMKHYLLLLFSYLFCWRFELRPFCRKTPFWSCFGKLSCVSSTLVFGS